MNPGIKQRLVGAIVLVALAVIFVPMLLDGDDSSMPAFGSNIPPKSGYQFESLDIPPPQPVSMEPKAAVIEREDAAPVMTGPVAEVEPEPPLAAEEGEVKTEPEPEAKTEPKPKPKPKPKPEAKAEAEAGEVKAWAVQVGSFSNSENALRLRDRLRGKGFDAFVEQVKSSGEAIYRVRVGPEASRERAESLMQRVKAKQPDLPALVMSHP